MIIKLIIDGIQEGAYGREDDDWYHVDELKIFENFIFFKSISKDFGGKGKYCLLPMNSIREMSIIEGFCVDLLGKTIILRYEEEKNAVSK